MADLPLTYEMTPEEEQAELTAAAAPLVAYHFPEALFVRDTIINAGFSHKGFLKLVRAVARMQESNQLRFAVNIGIRKLFFVSHFDCELAEFVKFARFAISPEGQEELVKISKANKLIDRGAGRFSASEVALGDLLNLQKQAFTQAMKAEMSDYMKMIEFYRIEIRKIEARMANRKREVAAAFTPVSVQKEMTEEEIANQA